MVARDLLFVEDWEKEATLYDDVPTSDEKKGSIHWNQEYVVEENILE